MTTRRRDRTRSLIQLGGLLEKSELLREFGLLLGTDLQRDLDLKKPVAALMGALLELKTIINNEGWSHAWLAEKGLRFMAQPSQPVIDDHDVIED